MDPNATLRMIAEALDAGDYKQVEEAAVNLYAWLSQKGFAPDWKAYPRAELYYIRFVREMRGDF